MNSKLKKVLVAIFVTALVVALGAFIKQSASAHYDKPGPDEPCVPSEAWTETIEHPAVTHEETVVDQEATPDVWANFQPNNHHEPFVGPPSYPSDARGSWNVHNQIPGGHAGPDGVYSKGNPAKGGNWFYRHNGTDEVTHTETVVDEEAYTETIEHPEVICDEPTDECDPVVNGNATYYPCDPTVPPTDDPEDCVGRPVVDGPCWEEEEPPSDIGDAISAKRQCIDYDEVKITNYINGVEDHVDFAPARPSDHCGRAPKGQVPTSVDAGLDRYDPEEGM